jgi:large subunit ribosomal protein L1
MANKESKRYRESLQRVEPHKVYSLSDAIDVLLSFTKVKFDESIEFSLKMGLDPKKSDQQVRGTLVLPHGTGKDLRVVVLAKGEKAEQAKQAGAAEAGDDELIEKIKGGWTDFDVLIATPDMMREVGKLGKVLGPRGLMPSPKAGTVTTDVEKAVADVMKGKVEFKLDKSSVINNVVGKASFSKESIADNVASLLSAIARAKPAAAKGQYMKSLVLATTMGPGVPVDIHSIAVS